MQHRGAWTTKRWLDAAWLRIDRGQRRVGPPFAAAAGNAAGGQPQPDDDPASKRMRVEAALLLAKSPLTTRRVAQIAHLADATEARTLIRALNQLYDDSGRAFRAEEVAGGYVLMSRPELAPWLRRLQHVPQAVRLTQPALETLAIVAYRQPVLRADIEAVRGVSCGEILRQLMEKDLVKIGGRSEELGRPYLYTTTRRFLQIFGLRNTADLPHADWFQDRDDISEDETLSDEPAQNLDHQPGNAQKESEVTIHLANEAFDAEHDALATVPFPGQTGGGEDTGARAVVDDDEDELFDDDDADEDDDVDDDVDDVDDDEEGFEDEEDEYEDDEEFEEEYEDDEFDEDEFDDEEDSEWEEVDDDDAEDEDWDEEEDDLEELDDDEEVLEEEEDDEEWD